MLNQRNEQTKNDTQLLLQIKDLYLHKTVFFFSIFQYVKYISVFYPYPYMVLIVVDLQY